MQRSIPITSKLTRQYAGQNRWVRHLVPSEVCAAYGPQHGRCTLCIGHGGLTHIAHNYSHNSGLNTDIIYAAWTDGDEDMEMDEGL